MNVARVRRQHVEFELNTNDGLRLYAHGWLPLGRLRSLVCLIHGIGEHSGRYEHVARFLNGHDHALLTFDLRGHGRSQGQRGHAPSYGRVLDDITQFLEAANARFPELPRFLYGHSLGATLALSFVLRRSFQLAGVIASAPVLRPGFEPPQWKISLGKILYRIWPRFSMSNEINGDHLSRDPRIFAIAKQDELCHNRVSVRFALDFLEAGRWVLSHAAEIPGHVLLMHGSDDRITSMQASQEFAQRAGSQCRLKIWDSLYHEIHNEPEKEQVLLFLVQWLEERLGTQVGGFPNSANFSNHETSC